MIYIIDRPITKEFLQTLAEERFGDMVKAVVDIEGAVMALGGELHADEEAALLEKGAKQEHLWGINIYIDPAREQSVEFDSMINIRPRQGNRSRNVEDAEIRDKILSIVKQLIP